MLESDVRIEKGIRRGESFKERLVAQMCAHPLLKSRIVKELIVHPPLQEVLQRRSDHTERGLVIIVSSKENATSLPIQIKEQATPIMRDRKKALRPVSMGNGRLQVRDEFVEPSCFLDRSGETLAGEQINRLSVCFHPMVGISKKPAMFVSPTNGTQQSIARTKSTIRHLLIKCMQNGR